MKKENKKTSHKNLEVLEFYKKLPFNFYSDSKIAIKNIKNFNLFEYYPFLEKIIQNKNFTVIELGCGVGWFINNLSYNFPNIKAIGVDFNPKSIEFAKDVKDKLNLNSQFTLEDLFTYNYNNNIDLIVSLGVLHHTNNCLEGIQKIISLKPRFFMLGLYHKYGRKPFLDYFKNLKEKNKNKSEINQILFEKYKSLDKRNIDEENSKSWFLDQVLHPHETQHTLEEVIKLTSKDYILKSTSINKFQKFSDHKELIVREKSLYDYGLQKIKDEEYYPGFFVNLFEKK